MAVSDVERILEDGVIWFEDSEVGEGVHVFENNRWPFGTEEGLELCRQHVFAKQVSIYLTSYIVSSNLI